MWGSTMTIWRNEAGQDLAEYSLLLAGLACLMVVVIAAYSTTLENVWSRLVTAIRGWL